MEPISATIATALALGASAALKSTAESAIKDAYAALKTLVKRRYAAETVDALEKKPQSDTRREAVKEDLDGSGAEQDVELLSCARQLMELVKQRAPEAMAEVGVSIEDVTASSVRISDVISSGGAVRVARTQVSGDIDISNIRSGIGEGATPKKV